MSDRSRACCDYTDLPGFQTNLKGEENADYTICHMHDLDIWENIDFWDKSSVGYFQTAAHRSTPAVYPDWDGAWRTGIPCLPALTCDRNHILSDLQVNYWIQKHSFRKGETRK